MTFVQERFTIDERPDVSFPSIVKKDGRRTEYKRDKIMESITLALRKRPVSTEQIDATVEQIEEKLLNLGLREVASSRLGELVMLELKKLGKIAYIRLPARTGVLKTLTSSRHWWMRWGGNYTGHCATVVFKVRGRPVLLILISRAGTLDDDCVQTVRVPAWNAPDL